MWIRIGAGAARGLVDYAIEMVDRRFGVHIKVWRAAERDRCLATADVLGHLHVQVATVLDAERLDLLESPGLAVAAGRAVTSFVLALASAALHGAEKGLRVRAKALHVPTFHEELQEEFGGPEAENWDELGVFGSPAPHERRGGIFS